MILHVWVILLIKESTGLTVLLTNQHENYSEAIRSVNTCVLTIKKKSGAQKICHLEEKGHQGAKDTGYLEA